MIEGVLWGVAVAMSFSYAYIVQFTMYTRVFGVELSDTDSSNGFQDAVTPPWLTNLALFTYITTFILIAVMWWQFGWKQGIGVFGIIYFGSILTERIVPKSSNHFLSLILRSMGNRYADFVKSGDIVRAEAMKHLLIKAGIDPDKMSDI